MGGSELSQRHAEAKQPPRFQGHRIRLLRGMFEVERHREVKIQSSMLVSQLTATRREESCRSEIFYASSLSATVADPVASSRETSNLQKSGGGLISNDNAIWGHACSHPLFKHCSARNRCLPSGTLHPRHDYLLRLSID